MESWGSTGNLRETEVNAGNLNGEAWKYREFRENGGKYGEFKENGGKHREFNGRQGKTQGI